MADPVEPAPANPSGTPASDPPAPATPPVAAADPAAPAVDPSKPVEPLKAAEPPKSAAPDKYDFKGVKLPEGVQLDEPLLKAIEPVFRELNLTQDRASKLIDAQAKHLATIEVQREKDFQTFMAGSVKQHQATLRNEWGTAYDANLAVAQRGIARFFGDPAMKELLDQTGLGQHAGFVKAFLSVGKMISEDTPPVTTQPGARKSNEQVFYGNPN